MPKSIVKTIRDYREQAFRGVVRSMILVPTGTKTVSLHSIESAREKDTGEDWRNPCEGFSLLVPSDE